MWQVWRVLGLGTQIGSERVAHGVFYILFFSAYLALDSLDLKRYQGAGVPPPITF